MPFSPRSVFDRMNSAISRFTDLFLAIGVVAIVGMMIVRIPPQAMDYMIALNICITVLTLLISLYIRDATKLPSFPTILLLATLFRLALNVSTTRLILLEANAGRIIFAFGDFVVQGNYVVGAVVFLVLVLVQFIVIAKGSERVAEVSARFTLDAMQGKQMSIDADFRNGLISPEESRVRRAALDRESKLYGAMDGAMKFVKGDAIAGIIISVINIVGGLVVGVSQQGMTIGEAAQVYSLLTIGDGLVSQIPALLLSVSAGLVVTRVAAGDDEDSHLAQDLFGQFIAHERALLIAAALLLVFAASSGVTGFPPVPFAVLAAALIVIAIARRVAGAGKPDQGIEADSGEASAISKEEEPGKRRASPSLVLAIGAGLEPVFLGPAGRASPAVADRLKAARTRIEESLGVPLPPITIARGEPRLGPHEYAVRVHGGPVGSGTAYPDKLAAMVAPGTAEKLGIGGEPIQLPWSGQPALGVPLAARASLEQKGIRVLDPVSLVMDHLTILLRRHARDFVTVQATGDMLEAERETAPDLVKSVTPLLMSTTEISAVLRDLVREQVPIRDLSVVLDAIARRAPTLKDDPRALRAAVRKDLRRIICDRFSTQMRTIRFVAVEPSIENALVASSRIDEEGETRLNLDLDERRDMLLDTARGLAEGAARGSLPVIVTRPEGREAFRALLAPEAPDTPVMSYAEISPEFTAFEVARIARQPQPAGPA